LVKVSEGGYEATVRGGGGVVSGTGVVSEVGRCPCGISFVFVQSERVGKIFVEPPFSFDLQEIVGFIVGRSSLHRIGSRVGTG